MPVTFDRESMLLAWRGEIQTNTKVKVEEFAGSLRFAPTTAAGSSLQVSQVDNDDAFDQVVSKLTAFWTSASAFIPTNFVITAVKWNAIDTAGKYRNRTDTRVREGLEIRGVDGIRYPTFICAAVTWQTGVMRGLARVGRTYLPTAVRIDLSNGNINSADQGALSGHAAGFIRDLGNWDGIDGTSVVPSVMSGLRGGATRAITGCSVGNQFDVQTRRKVSPETYNPTSITT
jgi:hypothetical protein